MATDRQTGAKGQNNQQEAQPNSANDRLAANSAETAKRIRALDAIPHDLMVSNDTWDEDQLRAIKSFEDAASLAFAEYGELVYADEVLGDGFTVLSDLQKSALCGLPTLLMQWKFNRGSYGNFVSMRVVVKNMDGGMSRYIVNDGSTGLAEQLARYSSKTGKYGGLICKRGFRKSEYTYTDETTGETRPAVTYYLDTSA